jgi:SAM-dependent methyltransferase
MTSISHNQNAWNKMAMSQHRLTRPCTDADLKNPLASVDSLGWLGESIAGQNVLCLAAGGGRHGPIYCAAGANVTVVDLSPVMLEMDKKEAQKRSMNIRTICTSMENLSMLDPASFDLVIHPVSTCYVPDVQPVFQAIARVSKPNALYISQHKQPASLQVLARPNEHGFHIRHQYYRTDRLPDEADSLVREAGTHEYLHRWEQIIGGICRAGFVIEDLVEPMHADPTEPAGTFEHRSQFVAPYVRIKARRVQRQSGSPLQIVLE